MAFTCDDPDVEHVVTSEMRLQDPDVRRMRAGCAELLHPQFREFGVSGRIWDRASILDMMGVDRAPAPATEDLVATRLAPHLILVTYCSRRPGGTTLRSSIWRRLDGGPWQLYFHQGTFVPP